MQWNTSWTDNVRSRLCLWKYYWNLQQNRITWWLFKRNKPWNTSTIAKTWETKRTNSNLRPMILLSMLRKILTVCIMDRVGSTLDHETPIIQAVYRKKMSITEQVVAGKMAIEQTTNARNETLHLVLLNMTKAFEKKRANWTFAGQHRSRWTTYHEKDARSVTGCSMWRQHQWTFPHWYQCTTMILCKC